MKAGLLELSLLLILFVGLQIWWISMSIRNAKEIKVSDINHKTEESRKKLEKIFHS